MSAVRRLRKVWRSRPELVEECGSCLLSEEPHLPSLCLLAVLTEHCWENGRMEKVQPVSVGVRDGG